MAKECLVTKYKAESSNNSLLRLNEFIHYVSISGNTWIKFLVSNTTEDFLVRKDPDDNDYIISATEGGTPVDEIQLTKSDGASFYIYSSVSKEIRLFIGNKQNIKRLGSDNSAGNSCLNLTKGFKTQSSLYMPKFEALMGRNNTNDVLGSFDDIKNMVGVKVLYIQINGDSEESISKLSEFVNLEHLELIGNKIVGNISVLGNIRNLLNFAYGRSKCSGTIESLIQAFRANGRTTGSMSGNSTNTSNVTFNGSTGNAKGTVTWTENTITMNGITVNA